MAKIWKCTYQYSQAAQTCDLGLHYQWNGDTGSDEATAQNVADSLDTLLRASVRGMLATASTLVELIVREELDPAVAGGVPETYVKVINQPGTGFGGTGTTPPELTPLVHRKTGAAVRGSKSWCFLPSPNGAISIVSGKWDTTSGLWTNYNTFAALLDDTIRIGTIGPGVFGNLMPVAYAKTRRRRALTPYTFNVNSAAVDLRPRWLRSRAAS